MEGYFQAVRGSRTTRQTGQEAMPSFEPNEPGRAGQSDARTEQFLADDSEPDPQFFVESWTIGVNIAVQNLQQRRQRQQDLKRQDPINARFHHLRTLSFMQERGIDATIRTSFSAAAIADSCVSDMPPQSHELPAQSSASHATNAVFEQCDSFQEVTRPLTPQGARRLLAVTTTSTREQIRAAYREMATRHHPDRLVFGTERERQLGTDRMAAINDAYRLLST